MSSTNKTTNYDLSQFIGSDKPAWLTDYNQDMAKIDAGIDAAQDTATGADGKADANTNNIGELTYLATTAKNNLVAAVNEVKSNADTAQNTASTALSNAAAIGTEMQDLSAYLDINTFNTLTVTASRGTVNASTNMRSATDSTGKLGKIYGKVVINNAAGGDITVTLSDTGLRPSTPITINCGVARTLYKSTGFDGYDVSDLTINTDGTATFVLPSDSSITETRAYITPYLIFAQNFGD